MFDIQGSYKVPFTFMAVVSLIGSTLFLPLGPPEVPSASEDISTSKSEVVS